MMIGVARITHITHVCNMRNKIFTIKTHKHIIFYFLTEGAAIIVNNSSLPK